MNGNAYVQLRDQGETLVPLLLDVVWGLSVIILLLLLLLFARRWHVLWRDRRVRREKEDSRALILSYLEGDTDIAKVEAYLRRYDHRIPPFTNVCLQLLQELEGKMKRRVEQLLNNDIIAPYFKRKLKANSPGQIIDSLRLYQLCSHPDEDTTETIASFLNYPEQEVAFAASLALMNTGERDLQYQTLRTMCMREESTTIAILELLVLFSEHASDDHDKRGEQILALIKSDELGRRSRMALIKGLGEMGYRNQAAALCNMLDAAIRVDIDSGLDRQLAGCLVESLGKLGHPELLPLIERLIKIDNVSLKISCTKALGALGAKGERACISAIGQLFDFAPFEVRHEAMLQLLRIGEPVLDELAEETASELSLMKEKALVELRERKEVQYGS